MAPLSNRGAAFFAGHNRSELMLQRIRNSIDTLVDLVCAFTMAAIVVLAIFQVTNRFALGLTVAWTEEIARFLAVWIVLLGAARCAREGTHIEIDLILRLLPRSGRLIVTLVASALFALLAVIIIRASVDILPIITSQHAPASGISMKYVYLAAPVTSAVLLYYLLSNIWQLFIDGAPAAVGENSEGA